MSKFVTATKAILKNQLIMKLNINSDAPLLLFPPAVRFDFGSMAIQLQFKVRQLGDAYAQEADGVTEQVMGMSGLGSIEPTSITREGLDRKYTRLAANIGPNKPGPPIANALYRGIGK